MNDKAQKHIGYLRKVTKATSVRDSLLNDLHLALILDNRTDILRLSIILGIYRTISSLLDTNGVKNERCT